jgi:ABC-type lipoprotein release transport system permease subunit
MQYRSAVVRSAFEWRSVPRRPNIRGLFVRHGIGLVLGLAAAIGFTRWMESVLFGVSPHDPITFAAMPIVLVAAVLLASYLPARQAVMVDPVKTLRAE